MVKRIGYDEYQEQSDKERQAAEAARKRQLEKEQEQKKKKEKERLQRAQEKLENKMRKEKKQVVAKEVKPFLQYSFLKGVLIGQFVGIGLGSAVFGLDELSAGDWDPNTNSEVTPVYNSYGEAIRDAYGMGDWEDEPFRAAVVTFLNLLITCTVMGIIISKDRKSKKDEMNQVLEDLRKITWSGVDVDEIMRRLGPSATKMLESFSAIDRKYFDHLAKGGFDKANYETCVAVISGYLKSHPKEYEEVIKIVDEAVLPEAIKKKYGKGKTLSFGAAKALSEIKR